MSKEAEELVQASRPAGYIIKRPLLDKPCWPVFGAKLYENVVTANLVVENCCILHFKLRDDLPGGHARVGDGLGVPVQGLGLRSEVELF